jgi:hypothetical protein
MLHVILLWFFVIRHETFRKRVRCRFEIKHERVDLMTRMMDDGRAHDRNEARGSRREDVSIAGSAAAMAGRSREMVGDLAEQVTERAEDAHAFVRRRARDLKRAAGPVRRAARDNTGILLLTGGAAVAVLGWLAYRSRPRSSRGGVAEARGDLRANAERALEIKRANHSAPTYPSSRTASPGPQSIPNERIAPSGAFEAEGHRPVLERSRKVR